MSGSTDKAVQVLNSLYEQGKLSKQDFKTALVDLGVDPVPIFDQQKQRVSEQMNVAGNYYAGDYYASKPQPAVLDEDTALARYLYHIIEER
jgi:hypothetical protein